MNVSDLITELKKCPSSANVFVWVGGSEIQGIDDVQVQIFLDICKSPDDGPILQVPNVLLRIKG